MVQLRMLSGKVAGAIYRFGPRLSCLIGRGADADLRLEEAGVWDRHMLVDLDPTRGFTLTVLPDAWAALNGQPIEHAVLRNGDLIDVGSVRMQFWFSQTKQRSLHTRERLTWLALAVLCAVQVLLAYQLAV
jgi:hypothetical protein